MQKYRLTLFLAFTIFTFPKVHATNPLEFDSFKNMANSDFLECESFKNMANDVYETRFPSAILTITGYNIIDPDGAYRKQLNQNSVDMFSDPKLGHKTFDKENYQTQLNKEMIKFLNFFDLGKNGEIDLNNPAVLKALITFDVYCLERAVYELSYMHQHVPEDWPEFEFMHTHLLNLINRNVSAFLYPVYVSFYSRCLHGYFVTAHLHHNNNLAYVWDVAHMMREVAREVTTAYLEKPDLTLNDFLTFSKSYSFDAFQFMSLTSNAIKPCVYMDIYALTKANFERFLASPNLSQDELNRIRQELLNFSLAHYSLSNFKCSMAELQKKVFPFDQTYKASKTASLKDLEYKEHLQQLPFDFWTIWLLRQNPIDYPERALDELFGMAITTMFGQPDRAQLEKVNASISGLRDLLFTYLDGLHDLHPQTKFMLAIIQKEEKESSKLSETDEFEAMMNQHIKDAGVEAYVLNPSRNQLMGHKINAFFARLESEKQAAVAAKRAALAAEQEALKAKTQGRADAMYYDKFMSNLKKIDQDLSDFVMKHSALRHERAITEYLGVPPEMDADDYIDAVGRFMNTYCHEKWHAGICRTLRELSKFNASVTTEGRAITVKDLINLDTKRKALHAFLNDADSFFEKEAKAQKKRLKAEAKAQEKAERAKQKAEEKAKRESIKRLSLKMATPSADPSPYPPVGEKRLSVKAEIAEKHKSATLRLVEKEQRKSLRQSVKDLLHIGEADTQKDKRDSKRFSQRSSKRKSEVLDETPEAPLDLSQFGAVDRASIDKETLEIWEGKRVVTHQDSVVAILDQLNGATSLKEISNSFSHGDNFEPLNASSKLKDFKFSKKEQVYSIRVHGKADKHRICFIWDDKEKKARKVQYGTYH